MEPKSPKKPARLGIVVPQTVPEEIKVFIENNPEIVNNISFTFTMNGQVTKVVTDNVLKSLRDLAKSITPTSIKTVSIFHYELNNKVYHRILRVQHMKMLLANENRKLMMAKFINNTLGLSGEDLYK